MLSVFVYAPAPSVGYSAFAMPLAVSDMNIVVKSQIASATIAAVAAWRQTTDRKIEKASHMQQ